MFLLALATWAVLDRDNLALVLRVFEKPGVLLPAFGSRLLFDALRGLHVRAFAVLSPIAAGTIAFVIVLIVSLLCGYRLRRREPLNTADCRAESVRFVAGTAILAFAFAVTTNYDYRWVFVLFCIPLLLRYLKDDAESGKWERRIAATALAVTVVVLWANGILAVIFLTAKVAVGSQMSIILFAAKDLLTWVLISLLTIFGSTMLAQRWTELRHPSAEARWAQGRLAQGDAPVESEHRV